MKEILGDWETKRVVVDGEWLMPGRSQKLFNHSPDGFNWGYGGSGPSQLALALLLKFGLSDELAVRHHQRFKFDIIATLPQDDFVLSTAVVRNWINTNVKEQF